MGGSWFYSKVRETSESKIFLFLMLIKGTKRKDGIATGITCTSLGDCKVQMWKKGVTIKRRNSS